MSSAPGVHCFQVFSDLKLNLRGESFGVRIAAPLAGSPAGCVMSVHVLIITGVGPALLADPGSGSLSALLITVLTAPSCGFALQLEAPARCLTSSRHQSCHLHFTLSSSSLLLPSLPPRLSTACCPTSHLSPCLDNSPLLPPSCSKSMISN